METPPSDGTFFVDITGIVSRLSGWCNFSGLSQKFNQTFYCFATKKPKIRNTGPPRNGKFKVLGYWMFSGISGGLKDLSGGLNNIL